MVDPNILAEIQPCPARECSLSSLFWVQTWESRQMPPGTVCLEPENKPPCPPLSTPQGESVSDSEALLLDTQPCGLAGLFLTQIH